MTWAGVKGTKGECPNPDSAFAAQGGKGLPEKGREWTVMSTACGPLKLPTGSTCWGCRPGVLLSYLPSDRPAERTGLRSPDTAPGSPVALLRPDLPFPLLWSGVPHRDTPDIGAGSFSAVRGHPFHCRTVSSIPGLSPLDTNSETPTPSSDNQKYLQILPKIPQGQKCLH